MNSIQKTISLALCLILAPWVASALQGQTLRPHSLVADENFRDPLGFHNPRPVFSWKLPVSEGLESQSAYRIVVYHQAGQHLAPESLVWDSTKRVSSQSTWVPYGGPPLKSGQAIYWRVKFWDERNRESDWSKEAFLEMGLLSNKDWDAQWIESHHKNEIEIAEVVRAEYGDRVGGSVVDVTKRIQRAVNNDATPYRVRSARLGGDPAPGKEKTLWIKYQLSGKTFEKEIPEGETFDPYPPITAQPAHYFRKEFKTHRKIVKARLYASSMGIFEFHLNGHRVGNDLLTPGYTNYSKRVETMTYDVTDMLLEGENAIGAILGEGWYAGNLLLRKRTEVLQQRPKLIGQLEITYDDQSTETISTDSTWKTTTDGPIRAAGLYHGEDYDARVEFHAWSRCGFVDTKWRDAKASQVKEQPRLVPKPMPAVRKTKTLEAISVNKIAPDAYIFDFGQNVVGYPVLDLTANKNQAITIRFAEMLNKDGSLYTENYRTARSQATYFPAGSGQFQWNPRLTFFGFRYVEVSGLDDAAQPELDSVIANVIHTDFRANGSFTSSHKKLDQLQSNIVWGQRGNFVDIPTDCPQRDERLGWTGDAQVFLPTSFFNFDVHAFWSRWLQLVRDDQTEDGKIPHTVPVTNFGNASPGWADVIVTAPWDIYVRTGDRRILEDNYAAMKAWLDVYRRESENLVPKLKGFGDWLQPYTQSDNKGDTSQELIAMAYFGRNAKTMYQVASALGKTEDAIKFDRLHRDIRQAFSQRYYDGERIPSGADTQTACLMGLAFDLIEADRRALVENQLNQAFEDADRHLRTGFLGTPLIAPVFDQLGHADICFELLFKESYPSWFFSINQGATTMWERWNSYSHTEGFGKAQMNSFNHYAYGAIGQFIYERIAGLTPDPANPGYKHFFIRPLIGGPLTMAKASLVTPYGTAESGWSIGPDHSIMIEAVVPPNSTATCVIPKTYVKGKNSAKVVVNGTPLSESGLLQNWDNQGNLIIRLKPRSYQFKLTR